MLRAARRHEGREPLAVRVARSSFRGVEQCSPDIAGIEAPTGTFELNNGGVSAVEWPLLLGTYTRSVPPDLPGWICSSFSPDRAPLVWASLGPDQTWAEIRSAPSCPTQRFPVTTGDSLPATQRLRAMLNLMLLRPDEPWSSDPLTVQIVADSFAKPLPVRAALLWASRGVDDRARPAR
jgi:hypothetical protein